VSTISLDGSLDGSRSLSPDRDREPRLKMKFNVYGIFLEMIASELKKMKRCEQRKVTRDDLLQVGIKTAAYMFMDYERINSNWPMELEKYYGITTKLFPNINK